MLQVLIVKGHLLLSKGFCRNEEKVERNFQPYVFEPIPAWKGSSGKGMGIMMKRIVVLGSTGSIGTQTLEVVREHREKLCVTALAAGSNIELLEQQIREFLPHIVAVYDEEKAKILAQNIKDLPVKVVEGMEGLLECAVEKDAQIVVAAIVGMIGIQPVIEAIKAKKDIALANKETLVTAGHLICPLAKEYGVTLLPVDSEHSAIFQVLHAQQKCSVSKLLLTASGGPFLGKKRIDLEQVTIEDALSHPNWSMGKKITVDSSTLVNKGLEVIEAKWLFDVSFDQIEVIIQPQSIIHSMVEFCDGAVLAQLGTPDMRLPIQYALFYPERLLLKGERLDFKKINQLTFRTPDNETFPALSLAYEVGKLGGSLPTVYNAANERAVSLFLAGKIHYLEIIEIIQYAIRCHNNIQHPSLEQILQTEQWTYELIAKKWN